MPSLVGNKPNQVPTNGDLGTLAFEDADNVVITGGNISGNFSSSGINIDSNTLVVDATNNRVGVGTATPATALDIRSSAGGVSSTLQIGSGQNDIGTIQFLNTTGSTVNANITSNLDGSNAGGDLRFSTKPSAGSMTERMRITAAGNVGIGTSSPNCGLVRRGDGVAGTISAQGNAVSAWLNNTGSFIDPIISWNSTGSLRFMTSTGSDLTGLTERMRLDSSGNLGLGVTPSAWGTTNSVKALQFTNGALWSYGASSMNLYQNAYFNGTNAIYSTTAATGAYAIDLGIHKWYTAPSGTAGNAITFTQAMTLDASGNLLVGTTGAIGRVGATFPNTQYGFTASCTSTTGTAIFNRFLYNTSTEVGTISSTGTTTSYVTTSDYRLKENVAPMTGALAKVAALKPCTYTWKTNGSEGQGFIAHELQAVVPDAVTGQKDAVDEEGNPVYQGIDTSFLVATLTAAIQELKAEVDSLKAQLNA